MSAHESFLVFTFCAVYLGADVHEVVQEDVLAHQVSYFRVLIENIPPSVLPDEITFDACHCRVNIRGSLIKGAAEASNYAPIFVADTVALNLVDFVSDCNNSFLYENDFVEFIQLVDYLRPLLFTPWLQMGQDVHHEVSVNLILPSVEPTSRLSQPKE